jgi:hypothetical protein
MAVAIIGPTLGMLINRYATSSCFRACNFSGGYRDMIYAKTKEEGEAQRKAFRKWRLIPTRGD